MRQVIVNNEKRMLQELSTRCSTSGRRGRRFTGQVTVRSSRCPTCSKGKQGRFSVKNLLGSALTTPVVRSSSLVRSSSCQCGLPKRMALELFKPFVMKRLVDLQPRAEHQGAKRMVERSRPVVGTCSGSSHRAPVMLEPCTNTAPVGHPGVRATAHRRQGIQIHPLVCTAFQR